MESIRSSKPKAYAIALLATVLLAACGPAIAPGGGEPAVTREGSQGPRAPDFEIAVYQGAEAVGGQSVNLEDLLSQGKPLVLNFWAGLCPPCRLEMPDFEEVHEALGDDVLLFGLDVGPFTSLGSNQDGQSLIQSLGVTYPAGTTADAAVVRDYELIGMPTTFFITPDGEIVRQWTGLLTEEKLTELVQELIAASETL